MPRLIDKARNQNVRDRTFVGRAAQLAAFRSSVRYVMGKEPLDAEHNAYPTIFLIHGEGGMGKSALLHQFRRIASEEGLPTDRSIVVDLDYQDFLTADALANVLAQELQRVQPGSDRHYREARNRREALDSRYRDLRNQWKRYQALGGTGTSLDALIEAHQHRLQDLELQQAKLGSVYTPSYVRVDAESALREIESLIAFRGDRGHAPQSFDELLQREFNDDAALFVNDARLGLALGEDLYELAEAGMLILAIDTYERASQYDDWLRAHILTRSSDRMLTVIAGRTRLEKGYRDLFKDMFKDLVCVWDLDRQTLRQDEVREYLTLRLGAEQPESLVAEVLALSNGIPVALEALGDQLAAGGTLAPYRDLNVSVTDHRAVVRTVTQRFLRYALDDQSDVAEIRARKLRDRQQIRALALLLQPDGQLASASWGVAPEEGEQIGLGLAARYSFIFGGYGLFEMHALVREFLRADMLGDRGHSFDWPTLESGLRRALAIVEARLAQAERDIAVPDDRYTVEDWCLALMDQLNILFWLGEDNKARRLLVNRWIESMASQPDVAAVLASLARELAPLTPSWLQLIQALQSKVFDIEGQNGEPPARVEWYDYDGLEAYTSLLEAHAHAVLCLLRASSRHILRVETAEDLQLLNECIALLEQGHEIDSTWTPIHRGLADVYRVRALTNLAGSEDLAAVLVELDRSLMFGPDDPETLHARGAVRAALGDASGAMEDYNAVLADYPDSPGTLANRGGLKLDLGQFDAALDDFNQALSLQPDNTDALLGRGLVQSQREYLDAALADFDQALQIRPDDADLLYNRALLKIDMRRLDEALADIDAALSLLPDNPTILGSRALIKAQRGELNEAWTDIEAALQKEPDHVQNLFTHAEIMRIRGAFQEALDEYAHVLALQPDNLAALSNCAWIKQAFGRLDDGLADINNVLRQRPDSVDDLMLRGDILRALNRLPEAAADYDRALDLQPQNIEILYNRGWLREQVGNHAGALEDFQAMLAVTKDESRAWYSCGLVYYGLGQYDQALAHYNRSLEVAPNSTEIYLSLCETYRTIGNYTEALPFAQQAVRLEPHNSAAYNALGQMCRAVGHLDEALVAFQRAIAIDPGYPAPRLSLAAVFRRLERQAEFHVLIELARPMFATENADIYSRSNFAAVWGDVDLSLELLQRALAQRDVTHLWARHDPDFEFVRDDPRFIALVNQEMLPNSD
jgi:tetratricopeptide (TPR) repeat protein